MMEYKLGKNSSVSVEIDNCYANYVSLDQLCIWQDLLEEINTN